MITSSSCKPHQNYTTVVSFERCPLDYEKKKKTFMHMDSTALQTLNNTLEHSLKQNPRVNFIYTLDLFFTVYCLGSKNVWYIIYGLYALNWALKMWTTWHSGNVPNKIKQPQIELWHWSKFYPFSLSFNQIK